MCYAAVKPDSPSVKGCKGFFQLCKYTFWTPMRSPESLTAFRSQHFHACFSLQGSLLVGRTPRGFQVLAPCWLLSVLRGAAAQREDAHWARQGVQEGPGGGPRPAGNHPVSVAGLLHPHPSRHQSGRCSDVSSRTGKVQKFKLVLWLPRLTPQVVLPPHLDNVRDKLAENIHELWGMNKIELGWTFGKVKSVAYFRPVMCSVVEDSPVDNIA